MYKTQAIILSKTKVRDKKILLSLLTEEYGRVTAWLYKKDCPVDIGSLCEIILSRKNSVNIIESAHAHWSPLSFSWKYKELISYLEIIRILGLFSMENQAQNGIIQDYSSLVGSLDHTNTEIKLTLYLCRFMKLSGVLSSHEFVATKELHNIYIHIDKTPIERVLNSKKIELTLMPALQSSIRYSLLSWNPNSLSSF